MKISIGSDHRGFKLKYFIKNSLKNITWLDVGSFNADRSDYPLYARLTVENILKKKSELGILICGSGVGMSIAANRYKYIYAALAWSSAIAKLSREDDNSNILVLPADFISDSESIDIIKAWLNAEFKKGPYETRIKMVDLLG